MPERFVHFSPSALLPIYRREQPEEPDFKPKGLWVSDETDYGWREWCVSEGFRVGDLCHAYDVELAADHNVFICRTVEELDAFTERWKVDVQGLRSMFIDWRGFSQFRRGIIVTPYQWSRRMARGSEWYYAWDCASGCIWDPAAIAGVTLRQEVA